MLQERTESTTNRDNKTPTQVVGGKAGLLTGQHLDFSKMAQLLSSGGGGFILRKAAASKQGVQKQTWQLAVQGYNRSGQLSCGRRPSTVPKEIAGCRDPG
jgi:hypothetical protein